MNINCPQCSAYLTVPEQYAGQLMKCPKCSSNFTVPALPAIDHEPAFAMAQSPPAPPPAAPTPASVPPIPDVPVFNLAPPEPAFSIAQTPSAPPRRSVDLDSEAVHTAPASTPRQAPTQSPRSSPPGTTTHALSFAIPSTILQWIPVGAAVLLFILQLFPWVGVYPGGVPVVTQSAWSAAFGDYGTPDPDMKKTFTIVTDADAKTANESKTEGQKVVKNEPSASPLMIFYLLIFLIALIVSIGVAVLPFVQVKLPPVVANILPWKWGILALLNGVLLLFLGLQILLNFGIESSVKEWARVEAENSIRKSADSKTKKPEDFDTKEKRTYEVLKGEKFAWIDRTIWLKLAFFLHILATAAAALMYWMEKGGRNQVQFEAGLRW